MKKLLMMMFLLVASITFSLERGEYLSSNLQQYAEQNKGVDLNDASKQQEIIESLFNSVATDYVYNYNNIVETLDKNDTNYTAEQANVAKELLSVFLKDIFVLNSKIEFVQKDADNGVVKLFVGNEDIQKIENELVVALIRGVSYRYIFPNAKSVTLEIYSEKELTNKIREAVL